MPLRLPRLDEYSAAVQNPQTAFKDPELRAARVKTNPFGLPLVAGGGFTAVFPFEEGKKKWAVRCFHKQVTDLPIRYNAISRFLAQAGRDYFIEARYFEEGIQVNSHYFPIIRMPWVDGYTINAFIERHLGQPQRFEQLARQFADIVRDMEQLGVAHGDLQHGNIMVVGDKLKLIDYDGMYVPALSTFRSTNIGHVNFQHPARREADFNVQIDRFSAILIYLALRALALKPDLWRTYGAGGENLLFQQADFIQPNSSKLLADLEKLAVLRPLIPAFRDICRSSLASLPSLDNFLRQQNIQLVGATHITATLRRQYEVVCATELAALRSRVGDRVEIVGKVVNIDPAKRAKNGQPYVFIDFGDWQQQCFRLVVWAGGLTLFQQAGVNINSFHNAWVSVTGNIEVFRDKYGHERLQIVVDLPSQIECLPNKSEAERRLAVNTVSSSTSGAGTASTTSSPVLAGQGRRKGTLWDNLRSSQTKQPSAGVGTSPQATSSPQQSGPSGMQVTPGAKTSVQVLATLPLVTGPASTNSVCAFCLAPCASGAKFCRSCGREVGATRFVPGQKLQSGKYTIKCALSHGAMGEVYIVTVHHQTLADRDRLLKVMRDYYNPVNPQAVKAAQTRFRQEAKTLSSLKHKHIPDIYDYFDEGRDACIVMEYIEGYNLEQKLTHEDAQGRHISGHPYARGDVLKWGITLCELLEYLSAQPTPVVHQDIKPANLVLGNDGLIYLVDFGTARVRVVQPGQASGSQASIYGTPGYAPPEQYYGKTEERTDVYALAATLYHLVTDDCPTIGASHSFRRLDDLGEFGQLLRLALNPDVTQRPSARAFRKKLEQLRAAVPGPVKNNSAPQSGDQSTSRVQTNTFTPVGPTPPKVVTPVQPPPIRTAQSSAHHASPSSPTPPAGQPQPIRVGSGVGAPLSSIPIRQPFLRNASRSMWIWAAILLIVGTFTLTVQIRARVPGSLAEARAPFREVQMLQGHTDSVHSLALSADGQTLISGSYDNTVRQWNLQDSAMFASATVTGSTTMSMAFAPDGQTMATGGEDGTIKVWWLDRPLAPRTLNGRGGQVWSVAFAPDGQTLATGSDNGSIRLWRVRDGKLLHTINGQPERVTSMAFTPDGGRLAFGSDDGTVKVWNVIEDSISEPLIGHVGPIESVAFAPGGEILASAGDDGAVRIWSVPDGRRISRLEVTKAPILTVTFAPDGHTLAAGSDDGSIYIWRLEDEQLVHTISGHEGYVESLVFTPDGKTLIAGLSNHKIQLSAVAP